MKVCPVCGKECDDAAKYCDRCGTILQGESQSGTYNNANGGTNGTAGGYGGYGGSTNGGAPVPPVYPSKNPMAVASLVLGILGIVFLCCRGFGIIPAILSIIFGVLSRGAIERSNGRETGLGFSTAGIILGIIAVILFVICVILAAIFTASAFSFFNNIDPGKFDFSNLPNYNA